MEQLSLNKYFNILIDGWKKIAVCTGVFLGIAIIFGIFLYSPSYESVSKLLIEDSRSTTFIVDLDSDRSLQTMGSNKNPIMTQMQILTSLDMAERVYLKLKDEVPFNKYKPEQIILAFNESIKLDNPPATDIIEFSARWKSPDDAQKIVKNYIKAYYDYNTELNKKSIIQVKSYINEQLTLSQAELKEVRNKIKDYKKENESIDIGTETVSVVQQITNAENLISNIKAQINYHEGKTNELSKKLNILPVAIDQIIDSVALGQNTNLISLQNTLNESQQQYASFKIRYPENTLKMRSLGENISEIKRQIETQMISTIGKTIEDNETSLISDSVRTEIISNLVNSQTELFSLKSQKKSLENTLSELKTKQEFIPKKQKILTEYLQKEDTLRSIVDALSTKLVEAKIRESEIVSNVSVIQNPTLPIGASFPTLFHIMAIFVIIGGLLGYAVVLGLYFLKDTAQGANELEDVIKAPILGVIPWLSNNSYNRIGADITPLSIAGIIYQKIITSIKIKCIKQKINVIGISSVDFRKNRSVISANIAKTLARCNYSVLVINADFRGGNIADEFNLDSNDLPDLTELLLNSKKLLEIETGSDVQKEVAKYIVSIPECKKLFLMSNKSISDNPSELIMGYSFSLLIQTLKDKFDYIIVDTPPILAVSDSISIAQYLDGLAVICGVQTSRSMLRKVRKLCDDNYVNLIGAIARDTVSELEIPESQYVQELS